jgi:crossover junction endodeoxyribonuclease RuvC
MRIIGIDPGIGRTGWGIIDCDKNKITVVAYGCIETKVNSNIPGRLFAIYDEIIDIIKEYRPEEMSIEELFFNKNVKTALIVGQARGVILLAGIQKHLAIITYTPLQVKTAITGYGRAEKLQIGKMVKTILQLKEIPKPDDVTDALAIALTHTFTRKYR